MRGLWPVSQLSEPTKASQPQTILQSLAPFFSLLSWEFDPPKTPVTPHNAPCSQSQPSCHPEAGPDLHAYAADSHSSLEHPGLEGPQTHLQHPVEMENFRTFTKAWTALVEEEDLGQLPYSPKTPTAALIISS